MKKLFSFLLLGSLAACSTESIFDPSTAVKVATIETTGDNGFLRSYVYSPDGQLERVESSRAYDQEYELEYDGEQLSGMSLFLAGTQDLYSRVTITYNASGTIRDIEVAYYDDTEEVTSTSSYAYEYDSRNRVKELWTRWGSASDLTLGQRFHWSGNNIRQVDYLDEDGELMHEFFYKYDNRKNYQRGLPASIYDPVLWGDHNIVEFSAKDYTGLLDLACNPCNTQYQYNLSGYPVSVTYDWGEDQNITYLDEE